MSALKSNILLFPMLTSASISTNIIPGIAKSLELFTITYKISEVIKLVEKNSRKRIKIKKNRLVSESNLENKLIISDMFIKEQLRFFSEATGTDKPAPDFNSSDFAAGGKWDQKDIEEVPVFIPTDKSQEKPSKSGERVATSDFSQPDTKTISVQPTWIKIDTPEGSAFIGIKVVPIKFKDEEKAMKFLEDDYSRKLILSWFTSWGRTAGTAMWNIWYKTLGGIMGRPAVSGIVKKDIIMARTKSKRNTFVLFNFLLLKDAYLDNADRISGLFWQKWSSVLAADDQNKIVYFCMKEFEGICSMIPYTLIYASMGKEMAKAFDTLEDARKTAGALFRRKTSVKRLLKKK